MLITRKIKNDNACYVYHYDDAASYDEFSFVALTRHTSYPRHCIPNAHRPQLVKDPSDVFIKNSLGPFPKLPSSVSSGLAIRCAVPCAARWPPGRHWDVLN